MSRFAIEPSAEAIAEAEQHKALFYYRCAHPNGTSSLRAMKASVAQGLTSGGTPPKRTHLRRPVCPERVDDLGFQIVELLKRGGRSLVYKAVHPDTRALVALKIFAVRLDHDQIVRFRKEGVPAKAVDHPNVGRILDSGDISGHAWVAYQLYSGRSLEDELREEGTISTRRAARIVERVARALAAAHALGLHHRNIKPANIFLVDAPGEVDVVKVLDFAIPALVRDTELHATPHMAAPEEFTGGKIDARTDEYSLGALLFLMLTGRPPFEGLTIEDIRDGHLNKLPPRLRALKPSAEPLEAIVARALEKRPEDRFQTVSEMATALGDVVAAPAALGSEDESPRAFPIDLPEEPEADLGSQTSPGSRAQRDQRMVGDAPNTWAFAPAGDPLAELRNPERITKRGKAKPLPDAAPSPDASVQEDAAPQSSEASTHEPSLTIWIVVGIAIVVVGLWAVWTFIGG